MENNIQEIGFYEEIRHLYDQKTVELLKDFSKINKKIAIIQARKNFLIQCRRSQIFPRFINESCKNYEKLFEYHVCSTKVLNFISFIKKKHLNLEIKNTYGQLHTKGKIKYQKRCKILSILPEEMRTVYFERQKILFKNLKMKEECSLQRKFDKLKKTTTIQDNEEWFMNLTNKQFPNESKIVLGMGPKTSIAYKRKDLPIKNILSEVESCLDNINSNNDKNRLRAKCTNIITNHKYLHDSTRTPVEKELSRMTYITKKFLRENEDVIICRADKGNVTVAIKKEEYDQKMEALLSDENTYKKVSKIPITSLEQKNNEIVKELRHRNLIDDFTRNKLITHNSNEAKLYGVIKHHKDNFPARPIVTNIGTAQSKLSKWLCDYLTVFMSTEGIYNIKNSFELKKKIENLMKQSGSLE